MEAVIDTSARVRAISRHGIDKVTSAGAADRPFALAIEMHAGARIELARAVIDASGTWGTPNPLAANGTEATGEAQQADRIAYGIPDVLGIERLRYSGQRVLVIGGGHSAANALLDLASLPKRIAASSSSGRCAART